VQVQEHYAEADDLSPYAEEEMEPCFRCGGDGFVWTVRQGGPALKKEVCPRCQGTGQVRA
jgi:DnaJ-class molecular chaperone